MKSKKLLYAVSLMSLSFGANAAENNAAEKQKDTGDFHYSHIDASDDDLVEPVCNWTYSFVQSKSEVDLAQNGQYGFDVA